jgi:hypothetical protein
MKRFRLLGVGLAGSIAGTIAIAALTAVPARPDFFLEAGAAKSPVLVELFTSEGCSSCPPADQLLARIQKAAPSAIVLSEHVTYWNNLGWKDPYSSGVSTERQSDYVQRLRLESSYTPQMVVDGTYEFVGSDASAASHAIEKASMSAATPITISDVNIKGDRLTYEIETGAVAKDAELMAVLAQDEGEEHVANGENGGRVLRHVQIARVIQQVATVKSDQSYRGSFSLNVPPLVAGSGWHLVVFLQQGSGGPILGVASRAVASQGV